MIRCPRCNRTPTKHDLAKGMCSAPVGAEGYCDTRLPVTEKTRTDMSMAVAYRTSALDLLRVSSEKINSSREDMQRCGEKSIAAKISRLLIEIKRIETDINQSLR